MLNYNISRGLLTNSQHKALTYWATRPGFHGWAFADDRETIVLIVGDEVAFLKADFEPLDVIQLRDAPPLYGGKVASDSLYACSDCGRFFEAGDTFVTVSDGEYCYDNGCLTMWASENPELAEDSGYTTTT